MTDKTLAEKMRAFNAALRDAGMVNPSPHPTPVDTKMEVMVCPSCGSHDFGTNGCGDCPQPDPEANNDAHYPDRMADA